MPLVDPLVLVRGVHFAATVWAAGTVAFMVLVAEPTRQLRAMAGAALGLAVLSGFAWFVVIAGSILDVPLAAIWDDGGAWTVLTESRFGHVTIVRLTLAVTLGLLLTASPFPGLRVLQLVAAAALAGLIAFVGHAGATPGVAGWLHLVSDLVHLLAAAAWLGGLPALALCLAAVPSAAVTAVRRFSVLGMVAVGVLLVSGVINSWALLRGPGDLVTTAYGRVLSLKLALFAAMVGIAAFNRYRLTPRLPAASARQALRRNSLVETGVGLAVMMLVGLLGTMVPGGHVHTVAAPPSEAAFVHIHTEAVMADVTIDRGRAGKSTAIIRLSKEDGGLFFARNVYLTLAPREFASAPIERTAAPGADGSWQIESLEIPRAGVWTLTLGIDPVTGNPVVLDAPIVITQCSNECW